MDLTIFKDLVNSMAFPILVCACFAYFIYQKEQEESERNKEREEKLYKSLSDMQLNLTESQKNNYVLLDSNKELLSTNKLLITEVNAKLDVLLQKEQKE